MIRTVLRWLAAPRPGSPGRRRECPRCGGEVRVPGPPLGHKYPYVAPTVAEVVRRCGCERAGRPPVPEWRDRAAKPYASW